VSARCGGASGRPRSRQRARRRLIDLFSDTGALTIDGSDTVTDEARPESVLAMTETVREYDVY
jgi:hypothetical protein